MRRDWDVDVVPFVGGGAGKSCAESCLKRRSTEWVVSLFVIKYKASGLSMSNARKRE